MKNILAALALLALLLPACLCTKNASQQTEEIIISLSKTPGRGFAPAYSIQLYNTGLVVLNRKKNMDELGTFTKTLPKNELNTIIEAFENANFFNFKEEYTATITDLPYTYISYKSGEQYKRITDYYGAPQTLKDLEKQVAAIVKQSGWQKQE